MNSKLPFKENERHIMYVNKHTYLLRAGMKMISSSLIAKIMEVQRERFLPNYKDVDFAQVWRGGG